MFKNWIPVLNIVGNNSLILIYKVNNNVCIYYITHNLKCVYYSNKPTTYYDDKLGLGYLWVCDLKNSQKMHRYTYANTYINNIKLCLKYDILKYN